MSNINVTRAWKDEEYRMSLSESERALLPENPAGLVELSDADLLAAQGGATAITTITTSSLPCASVIVTVTYFLCRD